MCLCLRLRFTWLILDNKERTHFLAISSGSEYTNTSTHPHTEPGACMPGMASEHLLGRPGLLLLVLHHEALAMPRPPSRSLSWCLPWLGRSERWTGMFSHHLQLRRTVFCWSFLSILTINFNQSHVTSIDKRGSNNWWVRAVWVFTGKVQLRQTGLLKKNGQSWLSLLFSNSKGSVFLRGEIIVRQTHCLDCTNHVINESWKYLCL